MTHAKPEYNEAKGTVKTGEFRLSYPRLQYKYNVNTRKEDTSGTDPNAKYSLQMLIPKTDKGTIKALEEGLKRAAKDKFNSVPKGLKNPIKDGDELAEEKGRPECEGHWVINCSSSNKPGMVDRHRDTIIDARQELYPGCFCRATLNAYAWEHPANGKGVSFGIQNLQKIREGTPLGGRAEAPESAFEDDLPELDDEVVAEAPAKKASKKKEEPKEEASSFFND